MTIDYESEYDNSGRVPNSAKLIDGYGDDAAAFREEWEHATRDLPYGPGARNDIDIFWPTAEMSADDVPIAMFIHGGYWQRLDRRTFSHMANGLVRSGIAVAIPSYTLAPEESIAGIVEEMRRAALFLFKSFGRRPFVFGHSAGGHLAACLATTNWRSLEPDLPRHLVPEAVGISGVYDLEPLVATSHNEALGLDAAEARTVSPIHALPDARFPFHAWVGADESSEFVRQSRDLARRWRLLGAATQFREIENANHFTVILPLADPGSQMVQELADMCRSQHDAARDEKQEEAVDEA